MQSVKSVLALRGLARAKQTHVLAVAALVAALGVGPREAVAQGTGTITGAVLDATTGVPLSGAQLSIEGTQFSTISNAQGRFLITGVPAGQHLLKVTLIGYNEDQATVVADPGRAANIIFRLTQSVLQLDELVVTGISGATQKTKLPFVVDKVSAANLPVPSMSAGTAIQGKIAGAQVVQGSGRPGDAPAILLRGPTSINSAGRSQEPLYIVDGVILASGLQDIDANSIESIEVVKGAAAASLYGSRAANGVVQITTKRGTIGTYDSNRYTIRSEFGMNSLEGKINIAKNHAYLVNSTGTKFVRHDDLGNPIEFDWLDGGNNMLARQLPDTYCGGAANCDVWNTYQEGEWPGGTYDHLKRFFDPGNFYQNYLAVDGRASGTRYHISFSNLKQDGVLVGQPGYSRNNFRINLDQGVRDNVQLSASAFYSRSTEGLIGTGGQGTVFFTLTRMPAGVDLMARDENGDLIINPDKNGENANPLYELLNRKREGKRERFMGSANLKMSPFLWLDLDANISYDRYNFATEDYYFKGFRTARESTVNKGYLLLDDERNEALNASLRTTVRRSFGDINTRTLFQYLLEHSSAEYLFGDGSNFSVADVPTLYLTQDSRRPRSTRQEVNAEGYLASTTLDIKDRYIIDALIRRDGSSLFGVDERWHTYYRGALAWRVSEESFFAGAKDYLNELKIRYSIGTAGGRPRFSAQYETYAVGDGGLFAPQSLGNRDLKPEFTIEQEAGIDLVAFDRFNLGVTYARSETRDQILQVPLPAYTGFEDRWMNAGTLLSKTWEVSLDFPVITRQNLHWSARFLYDRTRQKITELNLPPYRFGHPTYQGLEEVFYAREGEVYGTFYGTRWATKCSDLPEGVNCAEFQKNDDGYLVWVGEGRSWKDGAGPDGKLSTADDLWGTDGPSIRGAPVKWGVPIKAQDANGETFLPIGKTTPDFSFSISNTVSWKNFTLYGLVDAVMGFDVYNLPRQWAYFEDYHGDQDQAGKPIERKKPRGYYGSNGLYSQLSPPNSHFVEDGSFIKLRELSLRYNFSREQLSRISLLSGLDGVSFSLVGRNLFTITDYTGFDPEVGFGGGQVGSAALARFDGFQYPNFRTVTASVEIHF